MASPAFGALQDAFSYENLLLAGTDEFKKLNSSYISSQEADVTPAAIFLPRTTDDVSRFVTILKPFALDGSAPFAIRGAGQQPLPGCANIQDGITLDLRLLTGTVIKDGIVSIAAGERWGTVYEKLTDQGLGVTGSRSALGGIGGLALSGGLSFFSSREGFVCDNVINYEVVLASGRVVNANANENPDLFPSQVEALMKELKKPDASEETHLMVSIGYSALYAGLGGTLCMNQLYHTGTTEADPAELEPFAAVSPQIDQLKSLRVLTLKEAASEQAQQGADAIRCAYINTTVKADVPTLLAAVEAYTAALEPLKQCEGITCSLTLQAYPVSLLEKSASQGGNVLGLSPSDGPLVSVLALTWWKDRADDEKITQTFKGVIDGIDRDAEFRGTAVPFKYLNYAWDFQDPIGSYGAENKHVLQEVSRKYDPEGLFQKGVPGGSKLFP
ncbi:hypothetical protein VPNG_02432 [Cytospora leucostoma]|uniref:FAD-binding PCMH-type domain-containing protein n=1 Tax=Cytospora leucostoma TaxID=1230097 RepID=A0A423XH97_9PEZI|nr:hypothetical protein VPNG_02432 [Cytospora leucostoma]